MSGKHALITGSSRGIGRGIAVKLAEQGVNVAVHYYQNEAAASETLAQVRQRGADGFVVQADVLDQKQTRSSIRRWILPSNNGTPHPIHRRRHSSSLCRRRSLSWAKVGESSRSPMPRGAAQADCSRGSRWVQPRPRLNRSYATSQ